LKPLPIQHAELVEQAIFAAQAAGDLPEFKMPNIVIKPPNNPTNGDYSCPVAMALAKVARRKPLDIAEAIAKHLPTAEFVASSEVAPPGFINFRLSEDWLRTQVDTIIEAGEHFATLDVGAGKRAQVEFVSANPTGPLHFGRSRGAVVGDSIARILEAAGYDVEREYYFNNAGMQMQNLGKSMRLRYLQALGKPVEMPGEEDKTFYHGSYLVDFAKELVAEKGDSLVDADWQPFKEYAEVQMFEGIKATLARIGIQHDKFFNENSLYDNNAVWDVLEQLKSQDYTYEAVNREGEEAKPEDEGKTPATWFRSTKLGDVEDRVLVKSDGTPTYVLPDIAYHVDKINRGFDLLANILGKDHFVEAQVVKYGLTALSYNNDHLHVPFVAMVHMLRDGEILKLSTRSGNIETLDELIDQTSADAVRYMLMARNPDSHMNFDLDLAVKQSNENPVYYIQYAHVRCAGIFREAAARNVTSDNADFSLLGEEELRFIRKCLELAEQIDHGAATLSPHVIAYYALDLANQFHPMYDRVRVFGDNVSPELATARLRFYEAAQVVFKRVLTLMGMSAPERM
jgi:arginyl-tRNA synthetase